MKIAQIIGWIGFGVVIATLGTYAATDLITETQAKIGGAVGILLMFVSGLSNVRRS
ncbi:MAG: hypothetical protein AAGF20_01020 [Pseudomonadota bacterium]